MRRLVLLTVALLTCASIFAEHGIAQDTVGRFERVVSADALRGLATTSPNSSRWNADERFAQSPVECKCLHEGYYFCMAPQACSSVGGKCTGNC